jgi:hypothetical protein
VGITEKLHHIRAKASERLANPGVVDLKEGQGPRLSTDRQELVVVAFQERDVPLKGLPESRV